MLTGKLQIGWRRADITPPRQTLVQGQFHTRLWEDVISPITATALAIEVTADDGSSGHVVFLSCDLAGDAFKPDLLRKLTGRCDGLDLQMLTVNATHTHNAPSMERGWYDEPDDPEFMNPDEYRDWLTDRLADAVAEAWDQRQPGAIRRGFGYAVVGRCRRAVYLDGAGRMYGNANDPNFAEFEGCDDHAVNLLFTHDEQGELTGMICNVACPSQCDESKTEISADYWHNVREGIAERWGETVHLLPQCAPAGDASPHLMVDQTEESDLRDRMQVDDKGVIAHRLLRAIEEACKYASPKESTVAFEHEAHVLQLPRLRVAREEYELEQQIPNLSEEELKQQPWGFERLWPFGPVCELISRYENQDDQPTHETEVHVIRIGDVVFATNPFELYMAYNARMRARSKALQTFAVQLADGSGNGFYLPTQQALDHGHYSALIKSNWVGPEGGKILVDETVAEINRMFADENYPRTR